MEFDGFIYPCAQVSEIIRQYEWYMPIFELYIRMLMLFHFMTNENPPAVCVRLPEHSPDESVAMSNSFASIFSSTPISYKMYNKIIAFKNQEAHSPHGS